MKKWIGTIFFSLLFLSSSVAQKSDDKVPLPDEIIRQAVGRILIYNFRPKRIPVTIPIAKFISVVLNKSDSAFDIPIKQGWLPKIKNLTFKLIPEEEISDIDKIFVFSNLRQNEGFYSISVGRRDKCAGEGIVWILRTNPSRFRLWPSKNDRWGAVYCDNGPEEKP